VLTERADHRRHALFEIVGADEVDDGPVLFVERVEPFLFACEREGDVVGPGFRMREEAFLVQFQRRGLQVVRGHGVLIISVIQSDISDGKGRHSGQPDWYD
jgi:hypothetical protein